MSEQGLRIDCIVPPAALLDHVARRLHELTDAHGGLWFDASDLAATKGSAWPACNAPETVAKPIIPETMNAENLCSVSGIDALQLVAGQNTGFRLPDAVAPGSGWKAAILWHPPDNPAHAGSLLALRRGRAKNYVFLAETETGQLQLRNDEGAVSVTFERRRPGWQVTMIGLSNGRLSLIDPLDQRIEAAHNVDITDAADLLIGCRMARKGMPRALGAERIGGVWLWPDAAPQDVLCAALAEYYFWSAD